MPIGVITISELERRGELIQLTGKHAIECFLFSMYPMFERHLIHYTRIFFQIHQQEVVEAWGELKGKEEAFKLT